MSIIMESNRAKLVIPPMDGIISACEERNERLLNGDEPTPPPPRSMDDKLGIVDPKNYLETLLHKKLLEKPPEDVQMTDLKDVVTVIPGPPPPVMSPREVETNVRRLQAELLREETKLALMRRMYQLQNQPPKIEKREEPASGADKKGQLSKLSASNMMQQQNGFKNARGNPDHMMGKGEKQLLRDTKMQNFMKSGSGNQRNPPGVSGLGAALPEHPRNIAPKSQQLSLMKYQQNFNNSQSHGQTFQNSRNMAQPPSSPAAKTQHHPAESLEQQLSAEKVMLKRQMEKSILQIVPPRPPLPDLNFIPATVCPDFIALLGMELSANYAINSRNLIDQPAYSEPFLCLKCGEDVCPCWKVDTDTGAVVCEPCYYSCKSSLARLTHIETLKKAFAEVLEKEHDLDRQHAGALEKVKIHRPLQAKNLPLAPAFPQNISIRSQVAAVVNNHHNSSGGTQHNSRPSQKLQQQQHHAQGLQRTLRPALPPPPPSRNSGKPSISSPYTPMSAPLPFAPSSSAGKMPSFNGNSLHGMRQQPQDVQRQYLLDMISRGPKQQQVSGNGPWRK